MLFTQDAAFITHLVQSNNFSNAAGSRLRYRVYCFLYPEDYGSNEEEEEDDKEEEEGEDNEEEQDEEEEEDNEDEIEENAEKEEGDTLQ